MFQSFWKPKGHKSRKRKARRDRNAIIAANRLAVFERDTSCRRCHRSPRDSDHCHEVTPRSKLRGKSPEEIFNTKNTCRLCVTCHLLIVHTHIEEIVLLDLELGCNGEMEFRPQAPKPVPRRT